MKAYVPYLQNAVMLVVACMIAALVIQIPAVDHAAHHIQIFIREVVHHEAFIPTFSTR
ncbi:hypothetical protein [Alicyclobacillus vulcanalis]|uniref:Uncharacterized protein n=1 Tax=Alicyclobacillus vulcanalis TaxID=252246 RepID=A0A1N7PER8_9BACL|nr:hypothetical protein [Alicyclobacillus vulcanalis]SIT09081.1 hypothetical protein SAMN05421799_1137 [Alicyclobacillus vulcanalis]